ncbi:MAG: VWA domain-containing protein [Myxococcales bacterium]|nr:VWA domain-containing protein [Myxococcales bacterium]MBL0193181.1 VWA domain-containing protein [Myxococcales bacterium]HQY61015.1 VWA domain-containing protein [Polyangiaceae bacterium]
MRRARLFVTVAFASAALVGAACGGSSDAPNAFPTDTPDSGGGPSGTSTGGPNGPFGGGDAAGLSDAKPDGCASSVAQVERAKVDIIFVIDNSGSMTEEMRQIKLNVNQFAAKIGMSGLDYRVIFIVTKASSSTQTGNVICVGAPLAGANCADNPPLFWHINQSVGSTNSLQLILSTYDSPNAALAWNKHLRMDAYKVFVEVTDDQSSLAHTTFDTQLLAKAPAGMFGTAANRRYIFHTIAGWTPGTAFVTGAKCSTSENNGSQYQQLSQLTKGIIDSVCKTDYSGVLDNIAKGTVDRLACELSVPQQAASDPTTVAVQATFPGAAPQLLVRVTDESKCAANPNAWYYDDNLAPKKILLCADFCSKVNAAAGTKIEAVVGCKAADPR